MEWLAWRGMEAGLSYNHAWHLPWGEVLDYAAIKDIMLGNAKQRKKEKDFWKLMEYK